MRTLENGRVFATDEAHDFDEIGAATENLVIPANGIRYIEF